MSRKDMSIAIVVLVLLMIFLVGILIDSAKGAQTESIGGVTDVEGTYKWRVQTKTITQTATAANEVACVDTRGWDIVCYFADTGGTGINVDIDRFYADDDVYDGVVSGGAVNEDITQAADESGCEAVIAPYYCYDVDSSTAGTLSLTWLLERTITFE